MSVYHKIPTVYKRDPDTNYKTLIEGEYATDELAYLAQNEWVFTEKVDGTNVRVMYERSEVCVRDSLTFGGKTDKAQMPVPLTEHLTQTFTCDTLRTVFEGEYVSACLYGEGYGGRIQKAGPKYGDVSFILFDVRVGRWWLQREDVEAIATELGIPVVPIVGTGTLPEMVEVVRDGMPSMLGDLESEGLIARPVVELSARNGQRVITKLKTRDFR